MDNYSYLPNEIKDYVVSLAHVHFAILYKNQKLVDYHFNKRHDLLEMAVKQSDLLTVRYICENKLYVSFYKSLQRSGTRIIRTMFENLYIQLGKDISMLGKVKREQMLEYIYKTELEYGTNTVKELLRAIDDDYVKDCLDILSYDDNAYIVKHIRTALKNQNINIAKVIYRSEKTLSLTFKLVFLNSELLSEDFFHEIVEYMVGKEKGCTYSQRICYIMNECVRLCYVDILRLFDVKKIEREIFMKVYKYAERIFKMDNGKNWSSYKKKLEIYKYLENEIIYDIV